MVLSLRLALRIFDRDAAGSKPAGALTHQVWRGGATDLATRTMTPDPPRWLVLADHEAASSVPDSAGCLLSWDLEQVLPGRQLSPVEAGGVILVSMDIDPARDEEFNAWYNTEHIPHLGRVPGVLAARRFRSVVATRSDTPAYVALYHVADTAIYASRSWVEANETPWMQRMRRFQRNRTYFMFQSRVG
jgi:hypothetical protein